MRPQDISYISLVLLQSSTTIKNLKCLIPFLNIEMVIVVVALLVGLTAWLGEAIDSSGECFRYSIVNRRNSTGHWTTQVKYNYIKNFPVFM